MIVYKRYRSWADNYQVVQCGVKRTPALYNRDIVTFDGIYDVNFLSTYAIDDGECNKNYTFISSNYYGYLFIDFYEDIP